VGAGGGRDMGTVRGSRREKIVYRPSYRTIEWKGDRVRMLDQRRLPLQERYVTLRTHRDVAGAIRDMVIRGAPAIGIAAAMGCALGAVRSKAVELRPFQREMESVFQEMVRARPTAVNLGWAVSRMREICFGRDGKNVASLKKDLVEACLRIHREDLEINWNLGLHGSPLIGDGARVLTYCNTGTLATGGYGTALGVIRTCIRQGKRIGVIACETRPFLQGARLTAWELTQEKIPVTLITDNMAGHLMQEGGVDCVVVGADRVAANGDVANKIGTYSLAALCRVHRIPFYVAAPLSSVDLRCRAGVEIPIEQRDPGEVISVLGVPTAPKGCVALNPAFDVTPNRLVTAVITERGVAVAPYRSTLRKLRTLPPRG
jgi:methylthioribose-1-phosphate isomerase